MYRAAILRYDFVDNLPPTAKELKTLFKQSAQLLYGNDKRRSKFTPLPNKLHLVEGAFHSFKDCLVSESYYTTMLYVFDERANSTLFGIKYSSQIVCLFKLDENISDIMAKIAWQYDHLSRFRRSLQQDVEMISFLEQKDIGRKHFHEGAANQFVNQVKIFLPSVLNEIHCLENEAKQLFKSGWD